MSHRNAKVKAAGRLNIVKRIEASYSQAPRGHGGCTCHVRA